MPLTEADTCRKLIVPKLQAAGWDTEPHSIAEQRTIRAGRIVPVGRGFIRKAPRRVDYLLRFERNLSAGGRRGQEGKRMIVCMQFKSDFLTQHQRSRTV